MVKVLHYVSRMDRGGQETFIMNLFRNIDREKVMCDFLCTQPGEGDFDEEIRALGGDIYHIALDRVSGKWKQIDNMMILYRYLKDVREEYKVFHIHTQHAMDAFSSSLAAKMAGIKMVIVHSHNTNSIFHISAHKWFRHFLVMLPIRRFACSRLAGEWMYGEHPYKIIHNSIDLDKFVYHPQIRDKVREEMGWKGRIIIGHVGRFNEQKNHAFLIEIFQVLANKLPGSCLVLAGRGELEEGVRRKAEEYHLLDRVEFLGMRTDVEKLYQGMDLFVLPSLFEGLPVVLVEAQACDLPCVISDTITEEIDITDKVYRMSIGEAPECWAERIIEICHRNAERTDTSVQIRQAGYDMKMTAEEMEAYYCGGR